MDLTNNLGNTPLLQSLVVGSLPFMRREKPTQRTQQEISLDLFLENLVDNYQPIFELLLKYTKDISVVNNNGDTLLHLLVSSGILGFLLKPEHTGTLGVCISLFFY